MVFEEVDAALGEPLSRLMFEGPDERLRLTENAQPALMAASIAVMRVLEAASGRTVADLCGLVAGHSLGEYSALAAAGSLSIGDAARLLRLRGQAMQAAVPVGEGAMAAMLGLELAEVEAIAAEAAEVGVCEVGNDNAPGQAVVSGARRRRRARRRARQGAGAPRSMMLPVSAPFHCRLMAPAAEALQAALAEIELRAPAVPVVANVTAAPERDPATLARLLVEQVTGPGALAREPAGDGRARYRDDRRARLAPGAFAGWSSGPSRAWRRKRSARPRRSTPMSGHCPQRRRAGQLQAREQPCSI